MKTPEQQSEELKACPWCGEVEKARRGGLIDHYCLELDFYFNLPAKNWNARATSAAELVAKARGWCKGETTHVTYEGEYQMKNSEKSAAWLLAFLEAEVGKV